MCMEASAGPSQLVKAETYANPSYVTNDIYIHNDMTLNIYIMTRDSNCDILQHDYDDTSYMKLQQ